MRVAKWPDDSFGLPLPLRSFLRTFCGPSPRSILRSFSALPSPPSPRWLFARVSDFLTRTPIFERQRRLFLPNLRPRKGCHYLPARLPILRVTELRLSKRTVTTPPSVWKRVATSTSVRIHPPAVSGPIQSAGLLPRDTSWPRHALPPSALHTCLAPRGRVIYQPFWGLRGRHASA